MNPQRELPNYLRLTHRWAGSSPLWSTRCVRSCWGGRSFVWAWVWFHHYRFRPPKAPPAHPWWRWTAVSASWRAACRSPNYSVEGEQKSVKISEESNKCFEVFFFKNVLIWQGVMCVVVHTLPLTISMSISAFLAHLSQKLGSSREMSVRFPEATKLAWMKISKSD